MSVISFPEIVVIVTTSYAPPFVSDQREILRISNTSGRTWHGVETAPELLQVMLDNRAYVDQSEKIRVKYTVADVLRGSARAR
jgi:hypothetical protein